MNKITKAGIAAVMGIWLLVPLHSRAQEEFFDLTPPQQTGHKRCLLLGSGYYWTDYDSHSMLGNTPRAARIGEVPGIFVGNSHNPTETEPLNQSAIGYMVFGDCDLPPNAKALNFLLTVFTDRAISGHETAVTVAKSETKDPVAEAADIEYLPRNIYKLSRNMVFGAYNFHYVLRRDEYANYWGGIVFRGWNGLSAQGPRTAVIPLPEDYDRYLTGIDPEAPYALAYRYATGIDKVWLGLFTSNDSGVARFIGFGELNAPTLDLEYTCAPGYTFDPRDEVPVNCISKRQALCIGSGRVAFYDPDLDQVYKESTHYYGPFSVLVCKTIAGTDYRCESLAFHEYDFRIDWDPAQGYANTVKVNTDKLWIYGYQPISIQNLLDRIQADRMRGVNLEPENYIESMLRDLGEIYCRTINLAALKIQWSGTQCPSHSYPGEERNACYCADDYQPTADRKACEPIFCGKHGTWDPALATCKFCPENAAYDPGSGRCLCIPGTIPVPGQQICLDTKEICSFANSRFDMQTMKCVCDPGSVYNSDTRTCIVPEQFCPSNAIYDTAKGTCVCNPGLVPLEEFRACVTPQAAEDYRNRRVECGCNLDRFQNLSYSLSGPLPGDYHKQLGWCLIADNDFARAAAAYRLALDESPGDPDLHNDLGVALIYLKDADRAEKSWQSTLLLDPIHSQALENLKSLESLNSGNKNAVFHTSPMPLFFYCAY